ncbi:hypothetical protein ACKVMT_17110 [Halobacteriales archaeon Cl-PHB]
MNRRGYLSVAGAALLAGCPSYEGLAAGSSSESTASPTPTGEPTVEFLSCRRVRVAAPAFDQVTVVPREGSPADHLGSYEGSREFTIADGPIARVVVFVGEDGYAFEPSGCGATPTATADDETSHLDAAAAAIGTASDAYVAAAGGDDPGFHDVDARWEVSTAAVRGPLREAREALDATDSLTASQHERRRHLQGAVAFFWWLPAVHGHLYTAHRRVDAAWRHALDADGLIDRTATRESEVPEPPDQAEGGDDDDDDDEDEDDEAEEDDDDGFFATDLAADVDAAAVESSLADALAAADAARDPLATLTAASSPSDLAAVAGLVSTDYDQKLASLGAQRDQVRPLAEAVRAYSDAREQFAWAVELYGRRRFGRAWRGFRAAATDFRRLERQVSEVDWTPPFRPVAGDLACLARVLAAGSAALVEAARAAAVGREPQQRHHETTAHAAFVACPLAFRYVDPVERVYD